MPQDVDVEVELISEADTLAEARRIANSKTPAGRFIVSERVLGDGLARTVKASGDNVEAAFAEAERNRPAGLAEVSRKQVKAREQRTLTVEAADEASAREGVQRQLTRQERLDTLTQVFAGTRGFLGIGRKPAQWQAEVRSLVEVEITFKNRAKLAVQIGSKPGNWRGLLSALGALANTLNSEDAKHLEADFPYQSIFVLLAQKMDQPDYFAGIPFGPVTEKMVAAARSYVDRTGLPGMLGFAGGSLAPDRYRITASGGIGKITSSETMVADSSIATTVSCVARRNLPMHDYEEIGKTAFNAVTHYASLPIARYCFSLPYIESVRESRKLDPNQALITVYKGVESLLLEIWDELPQGGLITDASVEQKAMRILSLG
jgi:hypothetical protein